MKKEFKHIFSLCFGLYFLLAGTGFNIIQYCCERCEDTGIENVAANSCEKVHHSGNYSCCHNESEDYSCSNINHYSGGCHILRLKVETPSIGSAFQFMNNAIENMQLFYFENKLIVRNSQPDGNFVFSYPPPDQCSLSGRDILTLHTILLI